MSRLLPALLVLTSLLTACQSQQPMTTTVAEPVAEETPLANPARVAVLGLACPLCAHNVDTTLMKVPGVLAVAVDLEAGMLTIQLDSKNPPPRAAIIRAIDLSGVTFDRFES